jgi:hypothetical protein
MSLNDLKIIYKNGDVIYKTKENITIHKIIDTNFVIPSHTFSIKDFSHKNYTLDEINSVIKNIIIQQIYNMHVF